MKTNQLGLFEKNDDRLLGSYQPLSERMRPKKLSEFFGQDHIAGENGLLRRAIETDQIFSMILWGPPGCGKTTLAKIIAEETRAHFILFSAVLSGVKEIRSVIDEAIHQRKTANKRTILFVDEIHRFNKAQQDAFLPHVENGTITLIGATTENPSFEVIAPLLSRCRVIPLKSLDSEHIGNIIDRALSDKENGLGKQNITLDPEARSHLIRIADGDARTALNGLEIAASLILNPQKDSHSKPDHRIRLQDVETALQQKSLLYDKAGEEHYNLISAFHKSMRGSDPDASIYWMLRMLEAGEDPLYIGRRMVRFASEDVGNADPNALIIALNAVEAFRFLGHPEGELALVQAAVYLATAPKSNSLYVAYGKAQQIIKKTGALPVPLHIRNAPTTLMKNLGYGKDYQYAHDFEHAIVYQDYLPEPIRNHSSFYTPTDRGFEKIIKERMNFWKNIIHKDDKERHSTS